MGSGIANCIKNAKIRKDETIVKTYYREKIVSFRN